MGCQDPWVGEIEECGGLKESLVLPVGLVFTEQLHLQSTSSNLSPLTMRSFTSLALMGALGSAIAQNVSVCDKYTTALLMDNNSTNQYTLLTLLVNTVVIGNYTQPNKNAVPGILAKGEYMGTEVNLLPYFDGTLLSSNRGGDSGVSINFLDDGGAEPLKKNMPSNGKDSQQ